VLADDRPQRGEQRSEQGLVAGDGGVAVDGVEDQSVASAV
jgi:hypothetical protein